MYLNRCVRNASIWCVALKIDTVSLVCILDFNANVTTRYGAKDRDCGGSTVGTTLSDMKQSQETTNLYVQFFVDFLLYQIKRNTTYIDKMLLAFMLAKSRE